MKRRFKILLVLILAFTSLGLVLWVLRGGSSRSVTVYKKQLRARGEKLLVSEWVPVFVANPSNGAPELKAFLQSFHSPSNYPKAMAIIGPGTAAIGSTNVAPGLMLDYTRNVQTMVALRNLLRAPVFDFHLDYSLGFELPLDLLAPLKRAELLASATAVEALQAGDLPEAHSDLLASADLVRLFNNEPLIISGLVRTPMVRLALSATWEALQLDQWTDAQLSELQARWQGVDLFAPSEPALAFERAMFIEAVAAARKSIDAPVGPTSGPATRPASGGFIQNVFSNPDRTLKEAAESVGYWVWKTSWSHDEELFRLQILDAGLTAARRTKTTGAFVPAMANFSVQSTNIHSLHPDGTKHFRLTSLSSGDGVEKYLRNLADAEVMRRLLVTAIALKRFQISHGSYPESLVSLVPDYLPRVPVDLMDGKPMRYRLRPGGFLLYSVGEDGEDNGGDAGGILREGGDNWVTARDAVWPRPATPQEKLEYSGSATNAPAK